MNKYKNNLKSLKTGSQNQHPVKKGKTEGRHGDFPPVLVCLVPFAAGRQC